MARGLAPLQVVLCTRGGLAGAAVLDRLLASPELRVTGIVLSTRTHGPRRGLVAGTLRHLSRSGLAYSAYLWACTTGGDLAASASSRGSVRSRARREAIALLATRRVNDPDSHAFIAGCAPSLLVTAFFDQRVDAATRALAPLGGMNIHPSALPDLRGVDPVFQAMLRGRPLGVTVHRLVDDLDAGPIIARETGAANARESVLAATTRLYRRGADLLVENLARIAAGEPGAAQEGEGCYDSWPARRDVAALRSRAALVHAGDLWRNRPH